MFNPTLKMRETILFFLIVVINGLTWIVSDIGLDTCVRGGEERSGLVLINREVRERLEEMRVRVDNMMGEVQGIQRF